MPQRRRIKQMSLKDRLTAWAKGVRKQAERLPHGPAREAMLRKAEKADAAAHLNNWINSPGLQPPKGK
jgi:hypothetical protein